MSLPIHHARHGPRPHADLPLPGGLGLGLQRGRVHELCGPARVMLAALLLGESGGPALWIRPAWQGDEPYAGGLCAHADPARLIFARARRPPELLWAAEEALRSGAVPLVLVELAGPPGLTPVRRLHLAAGEGAGLARHRGEVPPLGLVLTPENGGAQGVESRWHLCERPSSGMPTGSAPAWTLTRLRARLAPLARWRLVLPGGQGAQLAAEIAPD